MQWANTLCWWGPMHTHTGPLETNAKENQLEGQTSSPSAAVRGKEPGCSNSV